MLLAGLTYGMGRAWGRGSVQAHPLIPPRFARASPAPTPVASLPPLGRPCCLTRPPCLLSQAGKSAYAKAHKVAKEKAAATLAAEVAAAEEAARLQVEEEARAAAEAAGEAEADGGSEVGSEAPVKKRKVSRSRFLFFYYSTT